MRASHRVRSGRAVALTAGIVVVPVLMGAGHPAPGAGHQAASPGVQATRAAPAAPATQASPGARATRPPSRVPELAVTVSDGRTTARAGEVLSYLVTVRDTGAVAAPHLTVTRTVSPGLRFISASDGGVETGGRVSSPAGLAAGGSRTFRLVARVVKTQATLLRLAAVACVALPGSRPAGGLRCSP